jgi:hypothetical protein
MESAAPAIRCRDIGEADIFAIANLLKRGFPNRTLGFWLRALRQLTKHAPPVGLPKYGYVLESDGRPVGAILAICSTIREGDRVATRCNLSSWYVEPAFRAYATLLVSKAMRSKEVTYLNVSPAPHTYPSIEARGFSRYCNGMFIGLPMLRRSIDDSAVNVVEAHRSPTVGYDASEQDILLQHAEYGCISLWCETRERAYPFVFRPRLAKHVMPCAQLIYCRDIADFVRFAGPIGRYLARRGRPVVIVDANGPLPGLIGLYRQGSAPKYFKGPLRPRLGDLAYTEYAVFGV